MRGNLGEKEFKIVEGGFNDVIRLQKTWTRERDGQMRVKLYHRYKARVISEYHKVSNYRSVYFSGSNLIRYCSNVLNSSDEFGGPYNSAIAAQNLIATRYKLFYIS